MRKPRKLNINSCCKVWLDERQGLNIKRRKIALSFYDDYGWERAEHFAPTQARRIAKKLNEFADWIENKK